MDLTHHIFTQCQDSMESLLIENGVEKLVPNLYYKCKYVIHVKALVQALKHGLVLEKIHRAKEFKQSAWM